jgi:hypothetical protein
MYEYSSLGAIHLPDGGRFAAMSGRITVGAQQTCRKGGSMDSQAHSDFREEGSDRRFVRDVIFAGRPPRGREWALMALCGLLALAIKGYNFAFNDQAVELPFVKYFMNPSLYPGDILFESVQTKAPFLWRGIALLAEIIPLPALILSLHLLTSALTIIGVWALAANLFRNRRSANLALVVVTLSVPMDYSLGLDPLRVVWPELVQRSVIFPLLVFAFVLALHRMLVPAMILAGLSFNIHPMNAGVAGLMIFAGALIDPKARRGLAMASVAGAVCALPILVTVALKPGSAGSAGPQAEQWFELLRLRMAPHLFPSTWALSRWLGAVLVLAVGLRSHLAVALDRVRHRTALAWFVVPVLLWLPGFLFTEVWPVPLVILAQLFRGTKLAIMVGLLYFAHHQVLRMGTGRSTQVVVALVALGVTPALWLEALPIAALLAVPHLLTRGPREADPRKARRPYAVALAGLLLVLAGGAGMAVKDRAEANWTNWWGGVEPQWRDAQVWVREHTPIDTMVLVPPKRKGFRFFSERPIVGSLKDGGPHENNAANMIEWWQRMQALGCTTRDGGGIRCRNFRTFSAEQIERLAERYEADLLVTYSEHDLPWAPLYDNGEWAVYDLRPVTG